MQNEDARFFRDWLDHPTDDDYWRQWSIEADYDRLTVPALHIGGWYDIFLSGTVKNFAGMRDAAGSKEARRGQKLLIGPWTHFPWLPVGGEGDDPAGPNVVDDWQLGLVRSFSEGAGERRARPASDPLYPRREPVAPLRRLASVRIDPDAPLPAQRRPRQLRSR